VASGDPLCGLKRLKVRYDHPLLFGSLLKRHLQQLVPCQVGKAFEEGRVLPTPAAPSVPACVCVCLCVKPGGTHFTPEISGHDHLDRTSRTYAPLCLQFTAIMLLAEEPIVPAASQQGGSAEGPGAFFTASEEQLRPAMPLSSKPNPLGPSTAWPECCTRMWQECFVSSPTCTLQAPRVPHASTSPCTPPPGIWFSTHMH